MNRNHANGLVFLLIVITVGAGAYYLGIQSGAPKVTLGVPAPPVANEFNTELDRIKAAEKIEDPYERCLAYPNPPEFDWSPQVIEALCRKLAWKMLSWKEIQDALAQNHPEILDRAFDGYLARNYSEPNQHGFLTWTFWWMFQGSSKWVDETTNRWVQADPESAYALAARGIHFGQAAYDARGGKLAFSTPQENFTRMHEFVGKARRDLEESLKRNPRLIAAYHGLLQIARLLDSADASARRDAWVQQALALDAADPWIYEDWIDAVQPQWSGSKLEMDHAATIAAEHADANPLLGLFKAESICNEANQYRCEECSKDGEKSLALFRKAGKIGPAGCFLDGAGAAAALAQDAQTAVRYYSQAYRFLGRDEWLAYRAQNLRSIGRGEWAIENLNDALVRNPDNTTLLHALALTYADAGRNGDVEKTYQRMLKIDPNNQIAGVGLSWLYITGLKAPDKARPLVDAMLTHDATYAPAWFEKTALCERDQDKPCYRAAAEKFFRYVNHDDPGQTANISLVQTKLRLIGADPETN